MQAKFKVNWHWLRKVLICLTFFGFLSPRNVHAWGVPPIITVPPVGITVSNGGTATFTATFDVSLTPLTVYWNLDGSKLNNANVVNVTDPVLGTTLSTLTVSNVTSANAGNYSVTGKNNGGQVTSGNAPLVVLVDPTSMANVTIVTGGCGMTNGGFRLQVLKPSKSNCVVEATTDFKTWIPVYTNSSSSTNISYLDSVATNLTQRYYRTRLQ